MQISEYDYTIIGAGCSGWQLAYAMMQQPQLKNKRIAICDDGIKQHRSWCFWSEDDAIFPELVKKSWSKLHFAAAQFKTTQHLSNYTYKYIPGESFFKYFNTHFLAENKNITLLKATVSSVQKQANRFSIKLAEKKEITSDWVFDSRMPPMKENVSCIHLWQHFRGWFIETPDDTFDEQVATLMDFTISQHSEVRFMYVLPFSKRQALIEFTLFSENILEDLAYDAEIKQYIRETLKIQNFTILEKENGKIPMTNFKFERMPQTQYLNIGTNAGAVKPTTGYAFKRIHTDSERIATSLAQYKTIERFKSPRKFTFYDNILLRILDQEPYWGAPIFKALFQKIEMKNVIRFLDEKSNFLEDITIFSSLPWFPFLKHLRR